MEQVQYKKGDEVEFTALGKELYNVWQHDRKTVQSSSSEGVCVLINDRTEALFFEHKYIQPRFKESSTTAVATVSEEEEPKIWVVEVQFPYSASRGNQKLYEYYAFGTFDELAEATHAVVSKEDFTDINDLLQSEEITVVRLMNVKPVSQQRYSTKLRYIIDIVDGTAYVERNMKMQRAEQLRKDIKKRIEVITQQKMLEKMVNESGDEAAAQLLQELKELEG